MPLNSVQDSNSLVYFIDSYDNGDSNRIRRERRLIEGTKLSEARTSWRRTAIKRLDTCRDNNDDVMIVDDPERTQS